MKFSRNALLGKVFHVPVPRRHVFVDVVAVLVVRIGTARTHLSYLVALKGVIARKNDSRKAKVFKVGDCISHSNKKYTTETFKLLFFIRYQTNFVSPKLEAIYRYVDLGKNIYSYFVLQLTRLNWSRDLLPHVKNAKKENVE